MTRPVPTTVVFDLDGVLRHWNDDLLDEVEASFGLPPRTIMGVAFGSDLGRLAITGVLPYREWMDAIRERVVARHSDDCLGALDEWEANVRPADTETHGPPRRVPQHGTAAPLPTDPTPLRFCRISQVFIGDEDHTEHLWGA